MRKKWLFIWLMLGLVACGSAAVSPTAVPATVGVPTVGVPTVSVPVGVTESVPPTAVVPVDNGDHLPQPSLFPEYGWADRSVFAAGLLDSELGILQGLPGAPFYRLDFEIRDSLDKVTGHEEMLYTNNEDMPLNEIYFHLYPNLLGGSMTIQNLEVNRQAVPVAYGDDNTTVLKVALAQPLAVGEQAIIAMDFVVGVPLTAEQNYAVLASVDDILTLAHFFPQVAVYDSDGWHIDLPSPQGDVTFADTSFYLVQVVAPEELVLAASGVEVSGDTANGRQRRFYAAGPMRDFYTAGSTRYETQSQTVDGITITSYALPEIAEGSAFVLDVAGKAIHAYNQRFGPFPFKELDIVSTPTLALGIEYPGIVAENMSFYDLDQQTSDGRFYRTIVEGTTAHEIGHQWFYSLVGNDQLNEPWVDESLTQYATWRYFYDTYGTQGAANFEQSLKLRWLRTNNAHVPLGMPVSAYHDAEYGSIIYGRGPLFVQAVADEIGQDVLDAALKDYVAQYRWGISSTEALKAVLEAHCQCDLTPLFTEWVYQ